MLLTRVMPCLLLRNTALVKTVQFKNASYVGDPVNTVKIFNEKEVDELILLDITATNENRDPNFDLIAEIATECFMPFTYGGGVNSIESLAELFAVGVEKVALNSKAVESPEFVREASARFGSQAIVISIDVKKKMFGGYEVISRSGKNKSGHDPVSFARLMEEKGAGEILLNAIDRDGLMDGYDLDLIASVSEAVTLPVIACGGAGSVEDFGRAVNEAGASALAAGSMVVYQGLNRAVLINFPTQAELSAVVDRPI